MSKDSLAIETELDKEMASLQKQSKHSNCSRFSLLT